MTAQKRRRGVGKAGMVFVRPAGAKIARATLKRVLVLALVLGSAACASTSHGDWGAPSVARSAVGRTVGAPAPHAAGSSSHQKIGRPYQVAGVWYVPAREDDYDETGVASWYGPNFHGRKTANGETFDQNLISAAHTTLPLPCLVRVTNLENGRNIVVRVNDRGPFVDDRIIDLSRAAADELGYRRQGTARVRVQYVGPAEPNASLRYASAPAHETPHYESAAPGLYSPEPPRTETRREPARADGPTYVQVASFRDRQRAIELVRRLGAGGPVFITSVEVRGQTWHRVMIGPWPARRAALEARDAVARMGFADARVVTRD